MIENTSADDSTDRNYTHDVVDAIATTDGSVLSETTSASAYDQRAASYVREIVGAKGPSDEPALDLIEYVQYVTSDQRRRRKQARNIDVRAAVPR